MRVFSLATDGKSTIRISGPIGESWWDSTGTTSSAFVEALDAIPKGKPVSLYVNSEGGSIKDGLEIYNAIKRRAADVTCYVDGYALSIASVIPLAASKVISPKGSVWMLHKPWTAQQGNADDMRKAAEMLDKHEQALVAIYAEETGQSPDQIRQDLTNETWFTGEEAVAYGLADESIDAPVTLAALDSSRFRRMPVAMGQVAPANTEKKGSNMDNEKTAIAGATNPPPAEDRDTKEGAALMKQVLDLRDELAKLKKDKVDRAVDTAIANGQIDQNQRAWWTSCLNKDDGAFDALAKLPIPTPHAGPLPHTVTGGNDAVSVMQSLKTPKARYQFGIQNWGDIRSADLRRNPVGANTHSGLSTITGTLIADGVTTVLQNRCAALNAVARDFSINPMVPRQPVIFRQVQAGGTAQSNATNFEDTTNFVTTTEPITITPAQLTAGAYITNLELNSGLRMADWVTIKGCELADKIMAAVAAVITTGNFTASPLVSTAAAFSGAEMRTLWGQLKKAVNKSVVLDGEYYAQLLPATREQYNVEEGGNWPGWNGVYLNTVWTGATSGTVGIALDPSQAIACSAGVPVVADSAYRAGLQSSNFTVPGIGLSVQMNSWYSFAARNDWMTLDVVFGAAKNDGTAAVLIKSS